MSKMALWWDDVDYVFNVDCRLRIGMLDFFRCGAIFCDIGPNISFNLPIEIEDEVLPLKYLYKKGRFIFGVRKTANFYTGFQLQWRKNPKNEYSGLHITAGLLGFKLWATYKTSMSGLFARNNFINDYKAFPMRYSIGIIAINNYDKIKKGLGIEKTNQLMEQISALLLQKEKQSAIYRYTEDKFIIILEGANKDELLKRLERINKNIISQKFFKKENTPIQVDISYSMSEKRRSDKNVFKCLFRAKKELKNIQQNNLQQKENTNDK